MILDNIKDLIKDMESVLIKDDRFKEDIHFKNMVKTIYSSNSTKLNSIYQMPSYDITPIILSRISELGKSYIGSTTDDSHCDEVVKELMALIKKLIIEVEAAHTAGLLIGTSTIDPVKLAQIKAAEARGDIKTAIAIAKTL